MSYTCVMIVTLHKRCWLLDVVGSTATATAWPLQFAQPLNTHPLEFPHVGGVQRGSKDAYVTDNGRLLPSLVILDKYLQPRKREDWSAG